MALAGEFVLLVPPMPQPGTDVDEHSNDTLALFVARARFVLCDDNRAEVIALCQRLDGIPLAIEVVPRSKRVRVVTAQHPLEIGVGLLEQ